MLNSNRSLALVLVLGLTATLGWASIENEPIRVTPRNSGPRYDIDDVERTRLAPDSDNQVIPVRVAPPAEQPSGDQSGAEQPGEPGEHIGHVSIRRIFLVPMMPASSSSGANTWPGAGGDSEERPSPFGSGNNKPFWPFLPPPRHHLFGADSASRSPTPDSSMEPPRRYEMPTRPGAGEREDSQADGNEMQAPGSSPRQPIDPIQLMVDMLHQALSSAMQPSLFSDLNGPTSPAGGSEEPARRRLPSDHSEPQQGSSSNRRPVSDPLEPTSISLFKPSAGNETKEETIEIDGKKYLKKTEINRKYIGENIFFTTRRLTLVPLNETDTTDTTTTTTAAPAPAPANAAPSFDNTTPASVATEAATVAATTTTTSSTEQPRRETEATTTLATPSNNPESPAESTTAATPSSSSETVPSTTTTTSGPVEPTTTTSEQLAGATNQPQVRPERLMEEKQPNGNFSITFGELKRILSEMGKNAVEGAAALGAKNKETTAAN